MPHAPKLSPEQVATARAALTRGASKRSAARSLGVDPATLRRALAKSHPKKTRKAAEFVGVSTATAPLRHQPIGDWTLERIRKARDAQMRGDFAEPVRLAEAMRTDDALFVAYHNRLAPHNAIASELRASDDSTRAVSVQKRALASVTLPRTVLEGVNGTLANHGIAVLQIRQDVSADGTRVDFVVEEWPLEHVRYNPHREQLETRTKHGPMVPIVHGDGQWVVVRKFAALPWTQEACLLPAALLWAGHAYALSDWAQSAKSHGQAKIAAQLPEMFALQEQEGAAGGDAVTLTAEAQSVLETLQAMVSGEAGAGLFPAGMELDFLANGSTAWQVFKELILDRKASAARVYNGTDATMGANGGAPGVDISILFGVASTKVQGDLGAVEDAINTGVYQTWAAINYGDSRYAPKMHYLIPDPDSARKLEEEQNKTAALAQMIKDYKDSGAVVDQAVVDRFAKICGIEPAPLLASGDVKAVPLPLAPTDIAKVVRVGPALRSIGLEPFGDQRDEMTITELDEFVKAKSGGGASAPGERRALSKLWALAGSYDESKHKRADDGKFASQAGGGGGGGGEKKPGGRSGGSEGNGPKGGGGSGEEGESGGSAPNPRDDKARLKVAERRLEQAEEAHAAALQEHKAAIKTVEQTRVENRALFDEQMAQRPRAAAKAAEYEKEAREVAAAKKAELRKINAEYDRASAEDDAAEEAGDETRRAETRRKLADVEARQSKAEREFSEADDSARALRREAQTNSRPSTRAEKLRAAIEADDARGIRKYGEGGIGANVDAQVGWALDKELAAMPDGGANLSDQEYSRLHNRIYLEHSGDRVVDGMIPDYSDLEEENNNVETSRRKLARAGRAARVHSREVDRIQRKIDGDGDGRTGSAEEGDDKPRE